MDKAIKIAIIAGEESGDLLGADLIRALAKRTGRAVELIGVGGSHLESLGLKTVFNPNDIALMGLGEVIAKVPRLLKHIGSLSRLICKENPDCLIVIDNPDFTHRVAKKVKAVNPNIPIIKYVAPSVWVWRPQRAASMAKYIDHVLVILPFEKQLMAELGGPPSTYVGHRLVGDENIRTVQAKRFHRSSKSMNEPLLLILPGSRRYEIEKLMPIFGEAAAALKCDLPKLRLILPTVERIANRVKDLAKDWEIPPTIVTTPELKWQAYADADVAMAASGTVSLELALCSIPMVLCYKVDIFSKMFLLPKIKIWSAALPNIIADEPIVPEMFNEALRSSMLVHQIKYLLKDGPARLAQLEGFEKVKTTMAIKGSSGMIGAEVIMQMLSLKAHCKF